MSRLSQVIVTNILLFGLVCQFLLMPLIGWIVIKISDPEPIVGVFVLIITSSPGGAFSNWWCALFNADLTLSVLLTTCSSLCCVGMLPLNLLIYVKSTYGTTVPINWGSLLLTIAVIISAVISGLAFRYWKRSSEWVPKFMTRAGTLVGLTLILYSTLVTGNDTDAPIFGNPWHFYFSIMTPGVFGFLCGIGVASIPLLDLPKPSRVAIAVETCFQNVGIAVAAALSIFEGSDSAWGVRVSLLYGFTLCIILAICLLICWKVGWTLAPPSDPLFKVMFTQYQTTLLEDVVDAEHVDEMQPVNANQRTWEAEGASDNCVSAADSNANLLPGTPEPSSLALPSPSPPHEACSDMLPVNTDKIAVVLDHGDPISRAASAGSGRKGDGLKGAAGA